MKYLPFGLWAMVPLALTEEVPAGGAPAGQQPAGTLLLTDLDNVRSQAVAGRLGMTDEGTTDRWFGLTTRQYRKTLKVRDR